MIFLTVKSFKVYLVAIVEEKKENNLNNNLKKKKLELTRKTYKNKKNYLNKLEFKWKIKDVKEVIGKETLIVARPHPHIVVVIVVIVIVIII